jgi:hypothetical protein
MPLHTNHYAEMFQSKPHFYNIFILNTVQFYHTI